MASERIPQFGFLLRTGYGFETHQNAVAPFHSNAAAVVRADYAAGANNLPDFQSRVERTRKTGRVDDIRLEKIDGSLRRAARRSRSDPPAHQHNVAILVEAKAPPIKLVLADAPVPDERTHLALKRSHDCDS